ncbi:hypothetical protein GCM10017687_76270 [Streptomyces echinatus]|uniref:hypothetical protein n=1 Tax=Streptomyces echinatus TaxID=67293 RepID=UPI0031F01C12
MGGQGNDILIGGDGPTRLTDLDGWTGPTLINVTMIGRGGDDDHRQPQRSGLRDQYRTDGSGVCCGLRTVLSRPTAQTSWSVECPTPANS